MNTDLANRIAALAASDRSTDRLAEAATLPEALAIMGAFDCLASRFDGDKALTSDEVVLLADCATFLRDTKMRSANHFPDLALEVIEWCRSQGLIEMPTPPPPAALMGGFLMEQ
jgi:hypothetical protein